MEVDPDKLEGLSNTERERIKALERENKELRQANEILKTASDFFAQAELDRLFTRVRQFAPDFPRDSQLNQTLTAYFEIAVVARFYLKFIFICYTKVAACL